MELECLRPAFLYRNLSACFQVITELFSPQHAKHLAPPPVIFFKVQIQELTCESALRGAPIKVNEYSVHEQLAVNKSLDINFDSVMLMGLVYTSSLSRKIFQC